MKRINLSCLVIFLTTLLSGQEIRVSIAPVLNVFHNKYVGDKPYGSPKLGLSTNVDYLFHSNIKLKFGVGLGYQSSKVLKLVPISPTEYFEAPEKISLCLITLKTIYNLSKEFYLSLDPSIDIQINHNSTKTTDNQSGIGISFGVGGNFRLNNSILFNVEPRLWTHNIIPFQNLDSPFRLSVAGINLGLVFGKDRKKT